MSSNNRNRRWVGGVGMAVGAAVAATLIGLANAPAARADTDLDPFEDLFGTAGINTWTPTADTDLAALGLGGGFDTTVDNFQQTAFACFGYCADNPFTLLANSLDPSAFSHGLLTFGWAPDNAIGDLAVGLDYTTFASGLGPVVDVPIDLLFGFDFI
jgi:hypothetical protein